MAIKLREQDNGVTVYQVTETPGIKSNIYCEIAWCSPDSSTFVYQKQNPEEAPNSTEFILCEFGTWEEKSLGKGGGAQRGPSITQKGTFFYRREAGDVQEFLRADFATGETEVLYEFPGGFQTLGRISVSEDERYCAYGVVFSYAPQRFGVELLDLKTGTRELIVEDPFICNPHTQFEPGEGKQIMVQHNRGCRFLPDGTRVLLVGPEGATEFLVDISDGKITRLQIGPPFTPRTTGHEAWIGNTKEFLVSVSPVGSCSPENGNLLGVRAGAPARTVSSGYRFGHVGTSRCGRYFACDDGRTGEVIIGSIRTGKNALVCRSESSFGSEQHTHPHPYLSPDLKWVVFNSDHPGDPQIHAASIPPEMIEGLEKE